MIHPESPDPSGSRRLAAGLGPRSSLPLLPPAAGGSHRGDTDLRRYQQVLRRRWRVVLATVGVVVAAVAVGTLLQTPIYRSSGQIELRKQGAESVPVEALFQAERLSSQYLETQYGILRSQALARRVVDDLRLDRVAEFIPSGGDPVTARDSARRLERIVDEVSKRLLIDPVTGSHIVGVHFESADPQLAARVVNSVFANYVAMRSQAGRAAIRSLSEQVDSVRGRLAVAERRLQIYTTANELNFLENADGRAENLPHERLRRLQQQLTDAEGDRYTKESLYSLLQSRGEHLPDSEVLRSLHVRVADLRGEYAKLRSTFTDEYPRTKQVKRQLDELEALMAGEQDRIRGEITGSYFAAVQRQDLLQQAVDEQKALVDLLGERTGPYRILAREVDAQRELYALLQQKLRGAEVSAALAATDVEVIDPPMPPLEPVRPTPLRNMQLALMVGLVLGLGLAMVREHLDETIRTVEELDTLPVPLLATIPSIATTRPVTNLRQLRARLPASGDSHPAPIEVGEQWPRIDRLDNREASLADAFSSLRTAILLDTSGAPLRSLLVTSTRPGEGKTTVSVNLALSLARLGKRVILIDADVRRPSVHRAFGLSAAGGLLDILDEGVAWSSVVHREVAPRLDVITAGARTGGPAELLSSDRLRALADEAGAAYDFVLFDSPALFLAAPDTRLLAPLVGGVVFVIRSGATPRDQIARVLRQVPNLVGVVLNDLDAWHFPPYYEPGPELDGVAQSTV
ncbi:MAG TPA: polysaccharide biosynthesis tyrosine autokinase [Longimicrobiaceae bacterium]